MTFRTRARSVSGSWPTAAQSAQHGGPLVRRHQEGNGRRGRYHGGGPFPVSVRLRALVDRSLAEVRLETNAPILERVSVVSFIEEMQVIAEMQAEGFGVVLKVGPVDADAAIDADWQLLTSAVSNLLQNAFKFTRANGTVSLTTRTSADRVFFDIRDECGGLPPGMLEQLFRPFSRRLRSVGSRAGAFGRVERRSGQRGGASRGRCSGRGLRVHHRLAQATPSADTDHPCSTGRCRRHSRGFQSGPECHARKRSLEEASSNRMCGIVGYLGGNQAVPVLLHGLRRSNTADTTASAWPSCTPAGAGHPQHRPAHWSREQAERSRAGRPCGHRPHPLGDARETFRSECSPAQKPRRQDRRCSQRNLRETS